MFRRILLLSAVGLLSACGTGSSDELPGTDTSVSEIRSLAVTGTDGVRSTGSGAPAISPYQNGGVFKLEWNARSSTEPYRIDWSVSTDAVSSSDDKKFFGRNCDQPAGDCQNEAATFNCKIGTDTVMTCAAGSTPDVTNMASYFSGSRGLPASYYLIATVCNGLFSDYVSQAIPVSFQ